MKKRLLQIAGIGLVALLSAGWYYHGDTYTVTHYTVTLRSGETVESASQVFYDLNENGDCYDMFRYRVLEANKKLFADGRSPQIGDTVIVPVVVKQ